MLFFFTCCLFVEFLPIISEIVPLSLDIIINFVSNMEDVRKTLVSVIRDHPIVLEKSMVPKTVRAKEEAWEIIRKKLNNTSGKNLSTEQLRKIVQNMKAAVKKKTDMKETGNKSIKLLEWEREFLDLMHAEENPVFVKVPGAVCVGLPDPDEPEAVIDQDQDAQESSSQIPKSKEIKKSSRKRKLACETEETAGCSTSELQRMLLLEQIKLTRLQVQREELQLQRELQANQEEHILRLQTEEGSQEFVVVQKNQWRRYGGG